MVHWNFGILHGPPRPFLWKQLDMKVSEKMWQSLDGRDKKIKAIASNAKIDREVHRGRYWEHWHYSKWLHCWNKHTKLWGTLPYLFQYMNPILENWNMQWVWQPIFHGNSSTGNPWQFHLWEAPLSQKNTPEIVQLGAGKNLINTPLGEWLGLGLGLEDLSDIER